MWKEMEDSAPNFDTRISFCDGCIAICVFQVCMFFLLQIRDIFCTTRPILFSNCHWYILWYSNRLREVFDQLRFPVWVWVFVSPLAFDETDRFEPEYPKKPLECLVYHLIRQLWWCTLWIQDCVARLNRPLLFRMISTSNLDLFWDVELWQPKAILLQHVWRQKYTPLFELVYFYFPRLSKHQWLFWPNFFLCCIFPWDPG